MRNKELYTEVAVVGGGYDQIMSIAPEAVEDLTSDMTTTNIEIGCGLIRIGRMWGVENKSVPSSESVSLFLSHAVEQGIRFFDTAPAYGESEERLGSFLKTLSKSQRSKIIVSTKCGEHWDTKSKQPYVDHSLKALRASIDQSIERLGSIDVLQLHKASVSLLKDESVLQAFEYARRKGVSHFGASVSDIETGEFACKMDVIEYIQLPYNRDRPELLPVIEQAKRQGKKVLFNRPLAMGASATGKTDREKRQVITDAFAFIAEAGVSGVILSGTASIEHLNENMSCFKEI